MQIFLTMNKLLAAIPLWAAISITILTLPILGHTHTSPAVAEAYVTPIPRYSEQDIKDRLQNISSVFDLKYTTEVGRRIKEYTMSYRVAGERILGRVDLYFPIFDAELSKRNLPMELKYVAVVESHLDPRAKSKSGARGLWQFISSTAKNQGLNIDTYVDERQDPELATRAALDYLEELYARFGDWTLAAAAYNCGPGGVNKAMRRSGGSDYWSIRAYLPKETQKYVPRIIAAIYLMQYYHEHNLVPQPMDNDVRYTQAIEDGRGHRFSVLAKELDMNLSDLKMMNAKFITDKFPRNNKGYALHIPIDKVEKYMEIYDPKGYKAMLSKRKETELLVLKGQEEELINSRRLQSLHPIDRLIFDRIRHKRIKRIYYRRFS